MIFLRIYYQEIFQKRPDSFCRRQFVCIVLIVFIYQTYQFYERIYLAVSSAYTVSADLVDCFISSYIEPGISASIFQSLASDFNSGKFVCDRFFYH